MYFGHRGLSSSGFPGLSHIFPSESNSSQKSAPADDTLPYESMEKRLKAKKIGLGLWRHNRHLYGYWLHVDLSHN
ncbi:hypothetical protein CCHR01_00561 [Colletotrichum chrysophilum]|uniref:Uncharacterized protein n=1 Tax=Colletotrichum chrysophilum TaxID=1836956 RepID=A0AAD9AZ90_9PEZI|nr:hypothetical protein CCHR01_00561 [Colletotrichum chrysophilum]